MAYPLGWSVYFLIGANILRRTIVSNRAVLGPDDKQMISAIDLGTFEWMKRTYVKAKAKRMNCDEKDVDPGPFVVLGIGATSGSVGASIVYPLNLLRTRYVVASHDLTAVQLRCI